MKKTIITSGLVAGLLLVACSDADELTDQVNMQPTADNVINVGGVSAGEPLALSTQTRAQGDASISDEENVQRTDAENIEWLRGPLFHGLDITYGKADRTNSRVAVLRLQDPSTSTISYSDGGLAIYTFYYRDDTDGHETTTKAKWYDNGGHFFEGQHVPARIINGTTEFPSDLATDQHNDYAIISNNDESQLGNYTLLSHYLAMPSGFTLNATVGRVELPFRHRLARVLAYILIDPDMGSDVTIRGYEKDGSGKDDPTTSDIRFGNVLVLDNVKDEYNETTKHHTYTPQWTKVRKAIPHFVDERGSYDDSKNQVVTGYEDHFVAYYNIDKKKYIYPTDAEWSSIHEKFSAITESSPAKEVSEDQKYERTIYGKVPVYDLIVRPTYTTLSRVMYDEEGVSSSATKNELLNNFNQIDFEITLSNNLHYTKTFEFDLDANYQTVVYLHISRERVDYNSSGSELWRETVGYEDYYGVNNQNGNNLSYAGSSWQRAYTNNSESYGITDGHYYPQDAEDKYAQYVDDATWIEMLREACVGGRHHGDYFILKNDISIPAAAFPDGFVFTGHLDGLDHSITLTDADYTKVTQQAYDSYETYTDHSDPRYIQLADGTYQIFRQADGTTYCSLTNTGTELEPVYEYVTIDDLNLYDGATAYVRDGNEEPYTYTAINFYKRVHHAEVTETVSGKTPTHLFSGLNGNYETAQESSMSATWEANVHKEDYGWVPFKTATDGWRAEVINLNVKGGTLFPEGTQYLPENAESKVTGHVRNCWTGGTSYNSTTHRWEGGERVPDYIPSIPEY